MRWGYMALAACIAAPAMAAPADWVAANQSKILTEYAELLAIPNVASDIPNIRKNADHIVGMMKTRGLSPRLLEGSGPDVPPAIYGEWKVPGAKRTLILYAHYDGQPVTPEDWKSTQPFQPKLLTAPTTRAAPKSRCRAPAPRSTLTGASMAARHRTTRRGSWRSCRRSMR